MLNLISNLCSVLLLIDGSNQYTDFSETLQYHQQNDLEFVKDFQASEITPEDFLYGDYSDDEDEALVVEENKKLKIDPFYLAVDSEFTFLEDGTTDPISVQGIFYYGKIQLKIFVINIKYKSKLDLELILSISTEKQIYIAYDSFEDEYEPVILNHFYDFLEKQPNYFGFDIFSKQLKKLSIKLLMYYSPKDLTYCFGYKNMKPYYEGKARLLRQRRNISGTFKINIYNKDHYLNVRDLYGYNKNGLKVLAESVGLSKIDVLDEFKKNMDQALITRTREFIEYSMNDADLLINIYRKKIESFNQILSMFGITNKEAIFTEENTPSTIGTTVHRIIKTYFKYKVFKKDSVYLALLKQGILNKVASNKNNIEYYSKLLEFKSLKELEAYFEEEKSEAQDMIFTLTYPKAFSYNIWQYASVYYLLSESDANTYTSLLGLTTGGRTVNERPFEVLIKNVFDIDIEGAYGSQIMLLNYPIGRPRHFTHTSNATKFITLGEFMAKHVVDFQSGLYKIVVEGELSFEQDLIFSKLAPETLNKNKIVYDKEDPDKPSVDAPFILLRKQIKNGFITPAIWKVLQQTCSTQQFKEIKNLKVLSAIYWSESDRVDSIEELADIYLKDSETFEFDKNLNMVIDRRNFKWYGISLREFIEPLANKRRELKALNDPVSFATQDSIKLVINSTWGLLTSPFFDLNNVVCSEIVTSSIRTYVWMMSKALNTNLSITDGGPYNAMDVSFITDPSRKPSLSALSSYYTYKNHRSISLGPLKGINWKEYFENNISPKTGEFLNINKYAQEHIQNFWKAYDLDFNIKVEHKITNTSVQGSYINKAHYVFQTFDFDNTKKYNRYIHKIRGFRQDDEIEFQNPVYELLLHFLKDIDKPFEIKNNGIYFNKKILKIASWRKSLVTENNQLVSKYGSNIQPGDHLLMECNFNLNNNYFYINDLDTYKTISRRSSRYKVVTNKITGQQTKIKQPLFEKYLEDHTIDEVIEFMKANSLKNLKK